MQPLLGLHLYVCALSAFRALAAHRWTL